jgi:hypothetical protein
MGCCRVVEHEFKHAVHVFARKFKIVNILYKIFVQVIIEAVRGAGYVSDIAIDDVKVANGSECLSAVTRPPFPTELDDQSE